jgi:hypothetical protein
VKKIVRKKEHVLYVVLCQTTSHLHQSVLKRGEGTFEVAASVVAKMEEKEKKASCSSLSRRLLVKKAGFAGVCQKK